MLSHIHQHPDLPQLDPNSYLLRNFPVQIKSNHLTTTLEYLTQSYQDASYTLNTETQVDWILEVLLIAFELPLSKWEQIDSTIDLYSKWLTKPTERLKPMQKNPQIYIRKMFSHLTLLFEKRSTAMASKADEKNHIYLANRILAIFLEMATTHGDKMDNESWEYGFKMILGITDITLTSKTKGIKNLAHGVLKTVFEYWICSLSYDMGMWKLLQKFASQWANYLPTVRQWTSICEALTLRVVRILYSVLEGTDCVQIEWQGLNSLDNPNQKVGNHITQLELPDEYTLFVWEQMIHVIGNPNQIQNPQVFLPALQGLDRMTGILAQVGSDIDVLVWRAHGLGIPYPPNTNSILRMFADWIFESVNCKSSEFNNGIAVAYKALCTIFCRKGGEEPSEHNLSLFYHAIEKGLTHPDPLITSAIMLYSSNIFTLELKGSFILIPKYIELCQQILCSGKSVDSENPPQLRSKALTMISSLICLPNHYLDNKTEADAKDDALPGARIWEKLKVVIQSILLESLYQERNQHNLQHTLWCICVFIHEHIETNPKMCKSFILALCEVLREYGDGRPPLQMPVRSETENAESPSTPTPSTPQPPSGVQFSPAVLITLFEVFSSLVPLYDRVKEIFPEYGISIVGVIARHIPSQILLLKHNEALYTHFLVQAFTTMTDVLHCSADLVFANVLIVEQVVSAITAGRIATKTLSSPNNSFIKKVENAAEVSLMHLLNFLGIFPGSDEYADTVSQIEDKLLIPESKSEFWDSDYVRFFMFEDQYIFTVVEQPPRTKDGSLDLKTSNADSGCTIVVRDVSGKHVWDTRLLYNEPPKTKKPLRSSDTFQGSSIDGLLKKTEEHPNNQTLLKFKLPVEQETQRSSALQVDHFSQLMDRMDQTEQEAHKRQKEYFNQINMSAQPPMDPSKYQFECKFQFSRLLLTHLGFFDYGTLNKMCQLRPSAALVEELSHLDRAFHRECYDIGVLFVAPSQDTEHDILNNSSEGESYSRFVSALGWNESSQTPSPINTGKLRDMIRENHKAPYWASVGSELIFHVNTRMTKEKLQSINSTDYLERKNVFSSNFVNIIWTEHNRPYFTPIIESQIGQQCHVIIHPMENKLLNISKQVSNGGEKILPFMGPLCDGMCVSERICPTLVRQTSVNAIRLRRLLDKQYTPPHEERKTAISRIAGAHKVKLSGREYYASLFNSDKKLVSRTQKHQSVRHSVSIK